MTFPSTFNTFNTFTDFIHPHPPPPLTKSMPPVRSDPGPASVFNIRLTHFQHLDSQSHGFIPDINRILTKYALHHVLDRYLSDEVFPSKCAWKRIIYEKTIQQSNPELFHECVESYPTCAPLILRSVGVSCIIMNNDQTSPGIVVYLQKDYEGNWSCCYAKIQEHMLTL